MYNNGSVSNKVRYQDICTDKFVANIAHVLSKDVVNNSMVEYPLLSNLIRGDSNIPYNYEIIVPFLLKHNIIVNRWIDCNDTYGIFDFETGKWTGAVGQDNTELMHSPKVELNEIFVSNIFNGNGLVPSEMPPDTRNTTRGVHNSLWLI